MTPIFEIKANNDIVTGIIRQRFISLSITDTSGYESDQLTLVLDDSPDPVTGKMIELPRKGVILNVSLGYKIGGSTNVYPAGRWVVDESEPSGGLSGNIITITANGADFTKSLKEKKTRSWENINLPGILETIGNEHDLTPKIQDSFKQVLFDHIDQTAESDLSFITRLAKDHDAIGKVIGDILVFNQRNSDINTTGAMMGTLQLGSPGNVATWRMNEPSRTKYGTFVAKWYDVKTAQYFTEQAGDKEPVFYIEKMHPNAETAKAAADAKYKSSKRSEATLAVTGTVPPTALPLAETNLQVSGLRTGIDGNWRVQRCSLTMSTGGFNYSVEAVKPDG